MALPRLAVAGSGSEDAANSHGRMEYFSKISELIQGDENRRQTRRPLRSDSRQHCDTDNSDSENYSMDFSRSVRGAMMRTSNAAPAPRNFELPTLPSSHQRFNRTGGFNGGFNGGMHDRGGGFQSQYMEPRDVSSMTPSMARMTRSSHGSAAAHKAVELPSLPTSSVKHSGSHAPATSLYQSCPGLPSSSSGPSSPPQKQFDVTKKPFQAHSVDSMDAMMSHHRSQPSLSRMGVPQHLEERAGHSIQGSRPSGMSSIGRNGSLPALHQGSADLCQTHRQTWNQATSSDSTASTPDVPQTPVAPWAAPWHPTASASEVPQTPVAPWAKPWQPTVAPDLVQSGDAIPPLGVPIRGCQAEPQAGVNPWSAPWQPRTAADRVLAPLGELPPVAEVSARSSEIYPSSLSSGAQNDKLSRDSSPLRSPIPGIGPPTPETVPKVDALLDHALSSKLNRYENVHAQESCASSALPVHSMGSALPVQGMSSALPVHGMVQNCPPPPPELHALPAPQPRDRRFSSYASDSHQAPSDVQNLSNQIENSELTLHGSPPIVHSSVQEVRAVMANGHWQLLSASPCVPTPAESSPATVASSPPPALDQLAEGNDRPPRSPMGRKVCTQSSKCMGAVPVLGALPSLSVGRSST